MPNFNPNTATSGKLDKLDRKLNPSSSDQSTFSETIRQDVSALKGDVMEMGRHVRDTVDLQELKSVAAKQFDKAYAYSAEELKKVEEMVREKPAKSVAIAFAAGVIASILFGRR